MSRATLFASENSDEGEIRVTAVKAFFQLKSEKMKSIREILASTIVHCGDDQICVVSSLHELVDQRCAFVGALHSQWFFFFES